MDLELDPLGDLSLTNGLSIVEGAEEVRQRLDLAINLNLTEFFSHINYGLPYIKNLDEDVGENLRYFLGDKFPDTASFVKGELDRYIRELPLVNSLESDATFDNATRQFTYNFKVVTNSGETVEFPPYLQQI